VRYRFVIRSQHHAAQRGRAFVLRLADTLLTAATVNRKIDINTIVRLIFLNLVSVPARNTLEGLRLKPNLRPFRPHLLLSVKRACHRQPSHAENVLHRHLPSRTGTSFRSSAPTSSLQSAARRISESCTRIRFYEILGVQTAPRSSDATLSHPAHARLPHTPGS